MWCDACASVGRRSIYINSLSTSTDGRGHPAVLHAELRPQARQRLLLHPAWRVQVNFLISFLQSKSNWSVSGWFSTMLPPRSQVRVCFRDNFAPLNIWPCTPCITVCSVWWSSGHHVILMLGLTSGCVPRQLPVLPVNEDGHVDFTWPMMTLRGQETYI